MGLHQVSARPTWFPGVFGAKNTLLAFHGRVEPRSSQKTHSMCLMARALPSQEVTTNTPMHSVFAKSFWTWALISEIRRRFQLVIPLITSTYFKTAQEKFPWNYLDQSFSIYLMNSIQFHCSNIRVHAPRCVIINTCCSCDKYCKGEKYIRYKRPEKCQLNVKINRKLISLPCFLVWPQNQAVLTQTELAVSTYNPCTLVVHFAS